MNNIPQLPKIDITPECIEEIKNTDKKEFRKSEAYKKHCVPTKERIKKLKKQKHKEWISNNWLSLFSFIVSILSLAVAVIALVK